MTLAVVLNTGPHFGLELGCMHKRNLFLAEESAWGLHQTVLFQAEVNFVCRTADVARRIFARRRKRGLGPVLYVWRPDGVTLSGCVLDDQFDGWDEGSRTTLAWPSTVIVIFFSTRLCDGARLL